MEAAESGYGPDALEAIRLVMSTLDNASDSAAQPARMPMWKAVQHIAKALGEIDPQGAYPATLDAIRQAAADGSIEIWGRRELPPPAEPGVSSEIWSPIHPMFWRTHRINSTAASPSGEEEVHSSSEPLIIGEMNRQRSLQVKRSEIEKHWPLA